MVRYLEEFLDYERRLDRGDTAGRDEEDMCMSFAPAVCCSKVLCHVKSKCSPSESGGEMKTDDRPRFSGLDQPLPFRIFIYLNFCLESEFDDSKLNLKFIW